MTATYSQTYPLDFNLYGQNDRNILYMLDTPARQSYQLEIRNTYTEVLNFTALTGSASATNYHFALHFRAGTLAAASLTGAGQLAIDYAAEGAAHWTMSIAADVNGADIVYFLCTDSSLTLVPDTSLDIPLLNVLADASQGTRSTRMALRTDNISFANEDSNLQLQRENHLAVVNHQGAGELPVSLSFSGGNTVLNDGVTANSLTLRLSNLLKSDVDRPNNDKLNFTYNSDLASCSKIIISFDSDELGGSQADTALATAAQLDDVGIALPANWAVHADSQGITTSWIIYPSSDQELAAGESLEIRLNNLVTAHPAGHTHARLHYENIPGYWDGQLLADIEKSPLLLKDGNVGIGTSSSTSKLDIKGTGGKPAISASSNSYGSGTISATNISDGFGIMAYNNSLNKATIYAKNSGGGQALHVYGTSYFSSTSYFASYVGIGTGTPKNRLDVNGGMVVGSSYAGSSTAPAQGMLVEGNVGIGTNTPKNKLDVEGGMVVGSSYAGSWTAPANGLLVEGDIKVGRYGTFESPAKLAVEQTSTSTSTSAISATNWNNGSGLVAWSSGGSAVRAVTVTGNAISASGQGGRAIYADSRSSSYAAIDASNTGGGRAIYATSQAPSSGTISTYNTGGGRAFYASGNSSSSGNSTSSTYNTGGGRALYAKNTSSSSSTAYFYNTGSGGALASSSADYAEYFEGADDGALEVATSVLLDNGKLRAAVQDETPIGIVSTSPMVVGNSPDEWPGKYLQDEFGRILMETVDKEGNVVTDADPDTETSERPIINPDYDQEQKYTTRAERPEWHCVGLLGQLPLRKGQPVASSWVKIKDLSATTELWLIK